MTEPTKAEIIVVNRVISGLRSEGYAIVSLDLIGRLSDYFHVNAKPTDDLARDYMKALDALIVQSTPIRS